MCAIAVSTTSHHWWPSNVVPFFQTRGRGSTHGWGIGKTWALNSKKIKTSEVKIDYSNIAHLAEMHTHTLDDVRAKKDKLFQISHKNVSCILYIVYLITKTNTHAHANKRRGKGMRLTESDVSHLEAVCWNSLHNSIFGHSNLIGSFSQLELIWHTVVDFRWMCNIRDDVNEAAVTWNRLSVSICSIDWNVCGILVFPYR